MYCYGLEDVSKELVLHTFSQPIPLPLGCMTSAYQYIQYNTQGECMGYNRSVADVVSAQLHFEKDWCLALGGMYTSASFLYRKKREVLILPYLHVLIFAQNLHLREIARKSVRIRCIEIRILMPQDITAPNPLHRNED